MSRAFVKYIILTLWPRDTLISSDFMTLETIFHLLFVHREINYLQWKYGNRWNHFPFVTHLIHQENWTRGPKAYAFLSTTRERKEIQNLYFYYLFFALVYIGVVRNDLLQAKWKIIGIKKSFVPFTSRNRKQYCFNLTKDHKIDI